MKMQPFQTFCFAMLLGGAGAQGGDSTVQLEGKPLPREMTVEGVPFVLHGIGTLKAGFVFKVYSAALYRAAETPPEAVMNGGALSLEVHYLHDTPKRHMVETAEETLARNLSPGRIASLRPRIDELHAAYRNGEKGGVASLTYIPGKGLIYAYDDQVEAVIPGDDFRAYLDVWLGKKPSSRTLKAQILEVVE